MAPEKHSTSHAHAATKQRHSIAVQVLDSVMTSLRKSHEMQQMLNQYR